MAEALLLPWVIRVCRLVLESICCSTWLYSTSCWVKVLESIGLVGSWFLSWLVSKVRKVLKLPDSCDIASELDDVPDDVAAAGFCVVLVPGVVMAFAP